MSQTQNMKQLTKRGRTDVMLSIIPHFANPKHEKVKGHLKRPATFMASSKGPICRELKNSCLSCLSCYVRIAILVTVHIKRPWYVLIAVVVTIVVIAKNTHVATTKGAPVGPRTVTIVPLADG